jgi:hypothetical protein
MVFSSRDAFHEHGVVLVRQFDRGARRTRVTASPGSTRTVTGSAAARAASEAPARPRGCGHEAEHRETNCRFTTDRQETSKKSARSGEPCAVATPG